MTTFVHIADQRDAAAIRCSGLPLPKARLRAYEHPSWKWGVFAMPVIEDFMLTHQWVRELKRRGHGTAVGVYFRLDDDEPTWAGLYNEPKQALGAAQAAARLRVERALGYEVVIPRAIRAAEIRAVRVLPAVGWRFFPQAKGKPPRCLCKYCVGSEIKSRRMRERLDPEGQYV